MEKFHRLTPDQRANLVAYLDGELDDEATQQIEQTLSQSKVARHEVEMLTRTWEMLDVLPWAKVSEEFTARTLSSIKVDETRRPIREQAWYRPARKGAILAVWVAGLALSAVLGFSITNRLVPNGWQQLVEDLPVIENIDVYVEVQDIEFLRSLQRSGLFDENQRQSRP